MEPKKIATQENLQALVDELKTRVVHQEEGKGLSTNDLTAELLAKINGAQSSTEMTGYLKETDLTALTAEDIAGLFASWQ